jgi:hypothetical protein
MICAIQRSFLVYLMLSNLTCPRNNTVVLTQTLPPLGGDIGRCWLLKKEKKKKPGSIVESYLDLSVTSSCSATVQRRLNQYEREGASGMRGLGRVGIDPGNPWKRTLETGGGDWHETFLLNQCVAWLSRRRFFCRCLTHLTGFSSHYFRTQIIYLVGSEYLCANFGFAVTLRFGICYFIIV